jgi:hypothetical protein
VQVVGIAVWIVLGVLLFALAPRIRAPVVGGMVLLMGLAVFAVRLHHAGPYPVPGPIDLAAGCTAILVGALLIRPPWRRPAGDGVSWATRALLGLSPIVFVVALVAMGHEAEEVVVLRTTGADGDVRETRLWVVDHEGAPWVVTSLAGPHDADLAATPRVEIVRGGETQCWLAERHVERETLVTLLQLRSEKYRAQRIAIASGLWQHFEERDDLTRIAVGIRFTPCPAP